MSLTALTARLAFSAAAFVLLLPAQQPQSELLHFVTVKVHPGMSTEWLEMQAAINAAFKKEGVPWRHLWSTAVFGEPTFISVFPVGKMERYESPNPLQKTMSGVDFANFMQKAGRVVASSHGVLARTRPDLGLSSGRRKPHRALATTLVVEPGKHAAFEAYIKNDLKPVWQKGGMKDVWVAQSLIGASPTEYTVLYLFDKWTELEGGSPMERALGPEGWEKLRSKVAGVVSSVRNATIMFHTEQSYENQ